MNLLKFLVSKTFLKHFGIAMGAGLFIFLAVFVFLHFYTRHGKALTVPDYTGLTIEDVTEISKAKDLRYEISDSVYADDVPPGTVVEQNPLPGSKVKENRNIFLIMNAVTPEMVKMPDAMNVSLLQAKLLLENFGLSVGKLIYVPDIAMNYVLKQKYNGEHIEPGATIEKGAKIDLVLGNGLSREQARVPVLEGLNLPDAKKQIFDAFLNLGAIVYDKSIETEEDSVNAMVWKQRPDPEYNEYINLGSAIDIWLTVNEEKLPLFEQEGEQETGEISSFEESGTAAE